MAATGKFHIKHICGAYIRSGPGYISRSSQPDPTMLDSQGHSQNIDGSKKGKGKEKVVIKPDGWGWGSNLPVKRRDNGEGPSSSKRPRGD